ncbi:MAG: EamA family transporter [Candidatus Deferrimicrobiaceae bacterium]
MPSPRRDRSTSPCGRTSSWTNGSPSSEWPGSSSCSWEPTSSRCANSPGRASSPRCETSAIPGFCWRSRRGSSTPWGRSWTRLTNSRNQFLEEIRAHWLRGIAAGFILFLSFTTYRLGLQMSKVSYAVSVRQVSAIVGVVGGILLFRERFGRIRLFGAALIVLGIACIKLG